MVALTASLVQKVVVEVREVELQNVDVEVVQEVVSLVGMDVGLSVGSAGARVGAAVGGGTGDGTLIPPPLVSPWCSSSGHGQGSLFPLFACRFACFFLCCLLIFFTSVAVKSFVE